MDPATGFQLFKIIKAAKCGDNLFEKTNEE